MSNCNPDGVKCPSCNDDGSVVVNPNGDDFYCFDCAELFDAPTYSTVTVKFRIRTDKIDEAVDEINGYAEEHVEGVVDSSLHSYGSPENEEKPFGWEYNNG